MTFGKDDGFWQLGSDATESRAIFDVFADAGGNVIDTAFIYCKGCSEEPLGDVVSAGWVHHIVISHAPAWQVSHANMLVDLPDNHRYRTPRDTAHLANSIVFCGLTMPRQ